MAAIMGSDTPCCIQENTMVTKIKEVLEVLHRIRVKLFPSYLPKALGTYLARTINEAVLSINDVCAALKHRGGFTGNYEVLTENVRQFFDEMAYQLCDGFAVNTGYFSIHPNIGGTFDSVKETHNHKKQPITFRFRARSKLKRLIEDIEVLVEGLADNNGWIDVFINAESDESNSIFVPGELFVIHGSRIKIKGDDPDVGLYFVPVDNPAAAVKATRIAENTSSKIIGIAPQTGYSQNRVEIRTQYSPGSALLKEPRIITSTFILEEA
jgi:hypothetical protein